MKNEGIRLIAFCDLLKDVFYVLKIPLNHQGKLPINLFFCDQLNIQLSTSE